MEIRTILGTYLILNLENFCYFTNNSASCKCCVFQKLVSKGLYKIIFLYKKYARTKDIVYFYRTFKLEIYIVMLICTDNLNYWNLFITFAIL